MFLYCKKKLLLST